MRLLRRRIWATGLVAFGMLAPSDADRAPAATTGPRMRSMRIIVAIVLVAVSAIPALGYQCPLLLKQLGDAVAGMNAEDAKVKQAQALITEARNLHANGRHADSIATAKKAARVLGVQLKVAPMAPAQEDLVRAAEDRIGP